MREAVSDRGGLPIVTLRPDMGLLNWHWSMEGARSRFAARSDELLSSRGAQLEATPPDRAHRILRAMDSNLKLVEACLEPTRQYANGIEIREPSLCDVLSIHDAGWAPDAMLPFFYQDWGSNKHIVQAKQVIGEALAAHCQHADGVAILGAGACGIVYELAGTFATAYGIDLSLPTLALAQHMLQCGSAKVHLPRAGWRGVANAPSPKYIRALFSEA